METGVIFDDTAHDGPVPEDNPEALFDFLTIQSLKGRFGDIETANETSVEDFGGGANSVYQNELDFETYVQQFPIDDTISQCFASSSETLEKSGPLYISGGKRPDPSSQKLRKKFGRKSVDDISQSDDDTGSRDPKRSKPGGVFSKRHKWLSMKYESSKANRKQLSSSDQSELDSVFLSNTSSRPHENGTAQDSNSTSDSQITSFSEVFMRNQGDQIVPGTNGNMAATSTMQKPKLTSLPVGNVDKMAILLRGNSHDMIQHIEDLSPEEATSLRDQHGNTLLHRCVLAGNDDVVKYLIGKFPEMTSDLNLENLTAVELAAKIGNYDCLKVMLERNQRRKSLGPSLVNRLLTISSQYGQVSCLNLLLQKLTSDSNGVLELPRDPRGNTAAHLAAKQGHLNCLQALVSAGYDVSSDNMLGQQPIHVAHQGRQQTCFEYLLLVHIAQHLIQKCTENDQRSQAPKVTTQLTENILMCFKRFNELFVETQQMLVECKVSIMQTLENLQHDLELFIRHTSTAMATKRKEAKEKLEEFVGEIERLEDTLEFSPLLEKEGALVRLLTSVNSDIAKLKENTNTVPMVDHTKHMPDKHTDSILRYIIKDIHQEYLLENWSVDHIYSKYLKSSSPSINSNPVKDNTCLSFKNEQTFAKPEHVLESFSEIRKTTRGNSVENGVDEALSKSSDDSDKDISKCENVYASNTDFVKEDEQFENESGDLNEDKSKTEADIQPTERPFAKLLSLDERIDMLIAGEKAKEKSSDSETLVSAEENGLGNVDSTGSVYTTTFTSITSESTSGLSDWYRNLGLTSLESSPEDLTGEITSDTASYWWDQGEARSPRSGTCKGEGRIHENRHGAHINKQLKLRLEQEDASYEELRRHRLLSHLRSVEQSRQASDNFREKITTAAGEIIGGFSYHDNQDATNRIVVDVTGALRKRADIKPIPKPRFVDKQKLFTLEDAIATQSRDQFDQSACRNVSPKMKWEDMSFTDEDDEDVDQDSISWYDARSRSYYFNGSSISERSTTPQSYV